MQVADQVSTMPTNKMVVMALITVLAYHFGGDIIPPEVMEAYGVLISVALAGIGAWLVPDRANIPR